MNETINKFFNLNIKRKKLEKEKSSSDITDTIEHLEAKEKIKFAPIILLPFFLLLFVYGMELGFLNTFNFMFYEYTLNLTQIENLDHFSYIFCFAYPLFLSLFLRKFRNPKIEKKYNKEIKVIKFDNSKNYSEAITLFFICLLAVSFISEFFLVHLAADYGLELAYNKTLSFHIIFYTSFVSLILIIYTIGYFVTNTKKVKALNSSEILNRYKDLVRSEKKTSEELIVLEKEILNSPELMKLFLNNYSNIIDDRDDINYNSSIYLINKLKSKQKRKEENKKEIKNLLEIYNDVYEEKETKTLLTNDTLIKKKRS